MLTPHFAWKASELRATTPEDENGKGMPKSAVLLDSAAISVATQRLLLGISIIVLENVQMRAAIRHHGQAMHKAQTRDPPPVHSGLLIKLL